MQTCFHFRAESCPWRAEGGTAEKDALFDLGEETDAVLQPDAFFESGMALRGIWPYFLHHPPNAARASPLASRYRSSHATPCGIAGVFSFHGPQPHGRHHPWMADSLRHVAGR